VTNTPPRPVYSGPDTYFEVDAEGENWDPNTKTVRWPLAWDCQLNIGKPIFRKLDNGDLDITLSLSGEALNNGIVQRTATKKQVTDYAKLLLDLVDQPHIDPDVLETVLHEQIGKHATEEVFIAHDEAVANKDQAAEEASHG
jgi:hypothetical protein